MEGYWSLVKYKDKTISFLTDEANRQEIKGIKRNVKPRSILANQLKKCARKGCQVFVVQVGYTNRKEKLVALKNIPIIQEFVDVFRKEILGLPPKWSIEFTIELIPGAFSTSKE